MRYFGNLARAMVAANAKKEWREGVAQIMNEVRRREAARAMPEFELPYYSSDNPLDGERLWA